MLKQEKHLQVTNPMSRKGRKRKSQLLNSTRIIQFGFFLCFMLLASIVYMIKSDDDDKKEKTSLRLVKKSPPKRRTGHEIDTKQTIKILALKTDHGSIRIQLRPDLSKESVVYLEHLVAAGCKQCRFYRAEPGIFQGVIGNRGQVPVNKVFGKCPSKELESNPRHCPPHDPQCGCHGPIMERGMVGWAGGTSGGPDFFIDMYKRPALHWQTQHTVWGYLADEQSFHLVDELIAMPSTKRGGMSLLNDEIYFTPTMTNINKET